MRRVQRPPLPQRAQTYLQEKHQLVVLRKKAGTLDVDTLWKQSRQTKTISDACKLLQQVMGPRERCMYCLDSHGTDVEHFKPKATYPLSTFQWKNWLVCCTECGRIKGSQFPTVNGKPLLVNPTSENPWMHIDFDPDTGNLMARFEITTNDWSPKGAATVKVLQLDGREALAAGYRKTYLKLAEVVNKALADPVMPDAAALIQSLKNEDEHGLLEWCLCFAGQQTTLFSQLKKQHAQLWDECKNLIS